MKGFLLGLTLVFALAQTTFALSTTDELELIVGTATATYTDNGACVGTGCASLSANDSNGSFGAISVSGTIGGWSITAAFGASHSPGLSPNGIDIGSLTATTTGPANGLEIIYSDKGFNVGVPIGGFTTTYSATDSGPGSTSQSAYFSNLNTVFTETTLIGTVGPFTSSNVGSKSGGPIAAVPNYSLTLDDTFTTTGASSFSVDGAITAVPEPASVALFGTVLAFCAFRLRRSRLS